MSLDPTAAANAVNSAAQALQSVGLPHSVPSQQNSYSQQQAQLAHNQFYQQQQAQQRISEQVRQHLPQYTSQDLQQQQQLAAAYPASYAQTAQRLTQHLQAPQGTGLAPPGSSQSLQQMTLPRTEFDSREELVSYIQQYAKSNGFGIVISHSNEKAIYFTCELGGTYRNKRNINDKERKRKLTTRKINCPFSMVANCKKNDHDEIMKWNLRITNPDHNHDKLNLNESFPTLRRRNPEINRQIRELYLKGNKPLVIEKMLKDMFKDILINREDIYNETRKMKREEKVKTVLPTDAQQQEVHTAHQLKAGEEQFDANIPSLLQQGLPMNLGTQHYQASPAPSYPQQGLYQMGNSVVNQALANAQQSKDESMSNIDITLVKQQGI